MKNLFLFFSFFFLTIFSNAQRFEIIDSLKNAINTTVEDTNRANLYIEISHEYEKGDVISANAYTDSALRLSEKLNFSSGIIASYSSLAALSWIKGNYQDALKFSNKNLEMFKSQNDKRGASKILGHLGLIYSEIGNYSEALKYYLEALKINEERNDTVGICVQLNNIGIVYCDQGNNEKALEFHNRALTIAVQNNDKRRMSNSFLNIGVVYKNIADKSNKKFDLMKAAEFYEKALKDNQEGIMMKSLKANYEFYKNEVKAWKAIEVEEWSG